LAEFGSIVWSIAVIRCDASSILSNIPAATPARIAAPIEPASPDCMVWTVFCSVSALIAFHNPLFDAPPRERTSSTARPSSSSSSLAGYAFSRLNFPGRDKIFVGYLATMMIPSAVIVIPLYILIRSLGMLDTYWALILPAAFTAYGTFMLRQFFMGIPKDLEDAAKIDGCGIMRVYWNVILPLSKPALATLSIFTFMGNCRKFFWPLIVITSQQKYTLQLGLAKFLGEHNAKWTYLMAVIPSSSYSFSASASSSKASASEPSKGRVGELTPLSLYPVQRMEAGHSGIRDNSGRLF